MASPDEIWLVDFGDPHPGEPAFHRPALIVGPSRLFDDSLPFVIVAPMTTHQRSLSFHVEMEPDQSNGLNDVSYVQCERIRSISRNRLRSPIGFAAGHHCTAVQYVLRQLLDFSWKVLDGMETIRFT
jgi:mRNA interferase MazF